MQLPVDHETCPTDHSHLCYSHQLIKVIAKGRSNRILRGSAEDFVCARIFYFIFFFFDFRRALVIFFFCIFTNFGLQESFFEHSGRAGLFFQNIPKF